MNRIVKKKKFTVMHKLLTIVGLIVLLVIPTQLIENIIEERESMQEYAIRDVRSKWALDQKITGPILNMVVWYQSEKEGATFRVIQLLPKDLNIVSEIIPETFQQGGYDVSVYRTKLKITGEFEWNRLIDGNNPATIKYDDASLTLGISDIRGVVGEINSKWGDKETTIEAGTSRYSIVSSGITLDLPNIKNLRDENISFSIEMDLNGSNSLSFIPLGKNTKVNVSSPWSSPKFYGNYIPTTRDVTESGFSSEWHISQLSRNYPQAWWHNENSSYDIDDSEFGVEMYVEMDDYKMAIRSSKYAILTIALTFLIFFLIEVLNKRKIHPFQYGVVGLSLSIFYILLVSISEKIGFNNAYAISTIGIVMMNVLYSLSVFKLRKLTIILGITLTSIYGFIFTTLQLVDSALLIGSIVLTLILGATMYFTRNIDWYNINSDEIDDDSIE